MGKTFSCLPPKNGENIGGYLRRKFSFKERKTDKSGGREIRQEDEEETDETDEEYGEHVVQAYDKHSTDIEDSNQNHVDRWNFADEYSAAGDYACIDEESKTHRELEKEEPHKQDDYTDCNAALDSKDEEDDADIDESGRENDTKEECSQVSDVSGISGKTDMDVITIYKVHESNITDSGQPSDKATNVDEIEVIPSKEGFKPKISGILKKSSVSVSGSTTKRHVIWGPDVKPPAREIDFLESVCQAFLRERSKLLQKKTLEQRHRLNMTEKVGRKPINNARVGMVTKGCRAPTPAVRTLNRQRKPQAEGKNGTAAAMKGPDRGIVWPNKIEEVYSSNAKAYFVEQFQRTELFRSRSSKRNDGNVTWKNALTPFQVWVIEHAGTTEIEEISNQKLKSRQNKAKAKVSCWRNDASVPQRKHQTEK